MSDDKLTAVTVVQRATEVAMRTVIDYLRQADTPTAEEAHFIIDKVLADYDCESPQGHIVASGVAGVEPHCHGSGLIRAGEPIVIDIFPQHKKSGYFADMSRTICLGKPSAELQNIYHAVLTAQELAIKLVRPGIKGSEIYQAVQEHFISLGYETRGEGREFRYAEGFVHALGHGVGKNIHEAPVLSDRSQDILAVGDIVAIEPGLYYAHIGGIRLEDMLVVTEEGSEVITNFPKEL